MGEKAAVLVVTGQVVDRGQNDSSNGAQNTKKLLYRKFFNVDQRAEDQSPDTYMIISCCCCLFNSLPDEYLLLVDVSMVELATLV